MFLPKQAGEVVILGSGGNSIDLVDLILSINRTNSQELRIIAILDDDASVHGTRIGDIPVEGPLDQFLYYDQAFFINGIGSPKSYLIRPKIISKLSISPDRYLSIVHPSAYVAPSAKIGSGVVLFPHTFVGARAKVGNHVLVLSNSVINHDCDIGEFCCLASSVSLSGGVRLGCCCYIGSGSGIRENVSIGERSLVGMGSVVLSDVEKNSVSVGVPAKPLKLDAVAGG